jgi:hypothetical protein
MVVIAVLGALTVTVGLATQVWAYPKFTSGCDTCHGGFRDGANNLHDMHRNNFVNSCTDCHMSVPDLPDINSSGNYPDYSCNGCHRLEGLVTYHVTQQGGDCSPCHSNSQPATLESDLPFFYQQGRSGIVNPCRINSNNGGEDWDGDGRGLDNDGDGLYDADDPDCEGIIPVDDDSWSTLKYLFLDQ